MGFSEAVRWWEEWQLRVLILASGFLQFFLFFAGILRKRCIPSWLRFLIWLAYLSSDAVVIYALATLFNWQKTQEWVSTHQRSARLQVLWAPLLLMQLGGQDGITAYNIEDNELWRRHVVTAVSQVAVAVYVFRKWSPAGDMNILSAGLLLFVVGFHKCLFKPWELKKVSISSLIGSYSASSQENSNISSPDEYVRAATETFREGHAGRSGSDQDDGDKMWKTYDLFVDLAPSYSDRLSCLKATVHKNPEQAHALVRYGLSLTFDRLYTKVSLVHGYRRQSNMLMLIYTTRITLTTMSTLSVLRESMWRNNNEAYDSTDVKITVTLLCLVLALDYFLPIAMALVPIGGITILQLNRGQWPDQVAQYNLIGYSVRNKNHKKSRRLATLLVCKDYIDQVWCMKPSKSSSDITKLVHGYITQAWREHHIKDMATYRAFNDNRGQWTLNQEGCGDSLVCWSLEQPFDESVLLWHLATDFCFHLTTTPHSDETAQRCRVISNYMMYLLFVNPEMLMTGARRFLFREAYKQLKNMIKLMPQPGAEPLRHESELAQMIAQNIQHASGHHQFRLIDDAWRLAQHLQNLCVEQDNAKMLRVIQGVWVEMLCFSAGRCRGYLHAKSLGKGGEYLSYVWLLMSYMGMETLAERMQRPGRWPN